VASAQAGLKTPLSRFHAGCAIILHADRIESPRNPTRAASCSIVRISGRRWRSRVTQPVRSPAQIAPGVWFLLGDSSKGYSNTAVIEMQDYLIVVDANYPGRARELIAEVKQLSPKPVRYVFDTHAHGDHSYGNSLWTATGATTLAYYKILAEMDRYEPARWQTAEANVRTFAICTRQCPAPSTTFRKSPFILKDSTREVDFLYLGWGHTPADGYVWLPKERVLCTGDAAVNGPRNKLWDANLATGRAFCRRPSASSRCLSCPATATRAASRFLPVSASSCSTYIVPSQRKRAKENLPRR